MPASTTPTPSAGEPRSKPLSLTDTTALFQRLKAGEYEARDLLVQRFMPLAKSLAARYSRSSESMDDLSQVAAMGLIKAIDRFDPNRGVQFSTFAVPTILGEIKRYFRDGWSIRVPRELQELILKLEPANERLTRRIGRAPTVMELADELGVSMEKVLEAREASGASRPVSLDEPMGESDDEGAQRMERLGGLDRGYEEAENTVMADDLLRVLPERERQVLKLRFYEDLSQTEIAERVGISQMHVSRLIRRGLARLHTLAAAQREADGN